MFIENGRSTSKEEWEYLEGVLDQGLVFGVWPAKRKSGFVHRIQFNNSSRQLTVSIQDKFGGKILPQKRSDGNPPYVKTYFIWTITNAEEGIKFSDETQKHLHFKKRLADRYASFLQGWLNREEDVDSRLQDFNDTKAAVSTEVYTPSVRNLSGRLDANGFIGIQVKTGEPLSGAYAEVSLGTKFPGLASGIQAGYGGRFGPLDKGYLWTIKENLASEFLQKILPHLRNMKERAVLALEFEDLNRLLKRKGRGSKQRDLLAQALERDSSKFNRADLLRLGYIEKSRDLSSHPI